MFWAEVRKSTILEASILHRYFNQVRRVALLKIRSGYNPTDRLDLEFFKKRLFFDKDEDATLYLAEHNIFPNDDGDMIVKELKQAFQEPDETLPSWLSGFISNKVG